MKSYKAVNWAKIRRRRKSKDLKYDLLSIRRLSVGKKGKRWHIKIAHVSEKNSEPKYERTTNQEGKGNTKENSTRDLRISQVDTQCPKASEKTVNLF